jgi:hypothetical protein
MNQKELCQTNYGIDPLTNATKICSVVLEIKHMDAGKDII